MKMIIILFLMASNIFASGGSVGGGGQGGGTIPINDGMIRDFDWGQTLERIKLPTKDTMFLDFESNYAGAGVRHKISKIQMDLNDLLEVTLKDGSVLRVEQLRELIAK